MQGVVDGLKRAVSLGLLDETTGEMLNLGAVGAFGVAPGLRHETQNKVIGIFEEILQKVRGHVETLLEEATCKVTELDASRSDLDSKVESAERAVKRACEEVDEATTAMLTAGQEVQDAEAHAKKAMRAKADAEKALAKATSEQEAFVACVDSHLRPLQDGELGEGGATPHKKAILPLLKSAGVEESLLLAFPSSCEKPVSARTSFDTMVFDAVGKAVGAKQEADEAMVREQATALEIAARDVEVAEAAVESCVGKKKVAEEALEQASVKKLHAEEVLAEAQTAKDNFEPKYANLVAAREECACDLDNFLVYNIGCFEVLRDGPHAAASTAASAVEGGA